MRMPRTLVDALRRSLRRAGYRPENVDAYHEEFARIAHLRAVFRALGIDRVLDLGANRGGFVRLLRSEVGYRGPIWAVEPHPEVASELRHRLANDDGVRVIEAAVTCRPGVARLRLAEGDDLSSLLDFDRPTAELAGARMVRTVEVEGLPLAALIDRIETETGSGRLFVKSDLQSYDGPILKAADRHLSFVTALMVEAAVWPIYRDAWTFEDMIAFLRANGFAIAGVYRASVAGYPTRAYDFDILAVRQDVIHCLGRSGEKR